MNNNLSLIIPIKERNEFTFRILSYLARNKFPYKIFVSDGSNEKKENKKIISLFKSELNIEYLSFPYDKDFRTFLIKMYETLKLVKSRNAILLPNDDFLNLDFLKNISDKSFNNTISGINLNFKINNFFKHANDFGRVRFFKEHNREFDQNLANENNLKRIEYIKYFHPFEAIHLKENLQKVFQMSLEFYVNNHKELMWFLLLIPLYNNKVIFVEKPLIARQVNTYSSEGFTLHSKSQHSSEERLEEFKNFIIDRLGDIKVKSLINSKNFPITPKISNLRKVIICLIYLKKFISKYFLNLYFPKKYNSQNYIKLYKLIDKKFK